MVKEIYSGIFGKKITSLAAALNKLIMREVRVEILVEEPSMEHFLRGLLPKLLPDGYLLDHNCFIRPHEGKSDLRKSIPRKAKTYPYWLTPVKLIIIHDQDSNDCRNLKSELEKLVRDVNGASLLLIRIACRELENWYLGDFDAVEKVYPESKASTQSGKAKFRNPDNLVGSDEMKRLSRNFTKSFAAKEIPQYLTLNGNKSLSFNHLINGIRSFLG